MLNRRITSHRELEVYARSFDAAMAIFDASRMFPNEERYSLTDQIRRSSRSVSANVAEAWRKRRYEAAFVSKLSDAEAEAAETQVWIEFAVRCQYLPAAEGRRLYRPYNDILRTLVGMIHHSKSWLIPAKKK